MELILSHNGEEWLASGDNLLARGRSLEELDAQVLRRLEEHGGFHACERVRVHMRFDMDGMPRWLRQYGSHYFNRVVTFSRPERRCDT